MKTSALIACLLSAAVFGCNQKQPVKSSSGQQDTLNQCYSSVVSKDSASLQLNEVNGKVTGKLHLMFAKKQHMNGDISGSFSGDTLFADYTYKLGDGKETFKNPMAFLRKDKKLYQGYGEIVTQYGRTFFDKKTPLTFDQGFVFEPVACK